MSISEPEDADEIFRRLTEDLDIDPSTINGVVTVSVLNDIELTSRYNAAKRKLYELKELIEPRTPEGREQHSVYHACLLEMKRRRLL